MVEFKLVKVAVVPKMTLVVVVPEMEALIAEKELAEREFEDTIRDEMVSANIEPEALILPKTSNFSDGDDVPMPILLLAETIKVGESLMFASSL